MSQNKEHDRIKKTFFTIISAILTILICLSILEIGVRLFYKIPSYPCTLYIKDSDLGYRLKPNTSALLDFNYYKQNISINSQGLRDKEFEMKVENEKRILALGDSFTFGIVEYLNQTFVKNFEKEINQGGGI